MGVRTGLVLGGGGVTGIAWEIGLLKGLRDGGADVTEAELVIGTSAGSAVGAEITSFERDLEDVYAEQCTPGEPELGAEFGAREMVTLLAYLASPGSGRRRRSRIGRAARRAQPGPADERLRIIESRMRRPDGSIADWPEDRELRITAVEVESGSFRVFDRDSGVDLLHAIAASCAVPLVWPPVEISGRHYIDGGVRSTANADLATGCEVVLCVAPLPQSLSRYHSLPQQLRRTGARRTAWIAPDKDSLRAIGRNVLDPARRPFAARAGAAQGRRMAAAVAEGWPVPR